MCMYHAADISGLCPKTHRSGCLVDEVCGMRANNMNPQDLIAMRIRHDLDHTGNLSNHMRLGPSPEIKSPDPQRMAFSNGLLFRQTHTADLRDRKNTGGGKAVIHFFRPPRTVTPAPGA